LPPAPETPHKELIANYEADMAEKHLGEHAGLEFPRTMIWKNAPGYSILGFRAIRRFLALAEGKAKNKA